MTHGRRLDGRETVAAVPRVRKAAGPRVRKTSGGENYGWTETSHRDGGSQLGHSRELNLAACTRFHEMGMLPVGSFETAEAKRPGRAPRHHRT